MDLELESERFQTIPAPPPDFEEGEEFLDLVPLPTPRTPLFFPDTLAAE